jgi:hypothetical protein
MVTTGSLQALEHHVDIRGNTATVKKKKKKDTTKHTVKFCSMYLIKKAKRIYYDKKTQK